MSRPAKPPFPYPVAPVYAPPLPDDVPMGATMAEMAGWWLEVSCPCNGRGEKRIPFRLLAAQRGWGVTLESLLGRLRCSDCGAAPASVAIMDGPSSGDGRHGAKDAGRLVIR